MSVVLFLILNVVMSCIDPEALMSDYDEACLDRDGTIAFEELCPCDFNLKDLEEFCSDKKGTYRYRKVCPDEFDVVHSWDLREECLGGIRRSDYCALCFFDRCNNGLHSMNRYPEGSEKHKQCQELIKQSKERVKEADRRLNEERNEAGRQYFKYRLGFWPEEIKGQRNPIN